MSDKEIGESQQGSQGITIGTQGNDDGGIPHGVKGTHHSKNTEDDTTIPNQERSSASNQKENQDASSSRH